MKKHRREVEESTETTPDAEAPAATEDELTETPEAAEASEDEAPETPEGNQSARAGREASDEDRAGHDDDAAT